MTGDGSGTYSGPYCEQVRVKEKPNDFGGWTVVPGDIEPLDPSNSTHRTGRKCTLLFRYTQNKHHFVKSWVNVVHATFMLEVSPETAN